MPVYDRFSALADTNINTPQPGHLVVRGSDNLWQNQAVDTALNGKVALADNGGAEKVVKPTVSGNYTVNLANGNVFFLTLSTTNPTTLTFAGVPTGKACSFTLYLKQPSGTVRHNIVWPSSVKWPDGTAPTISSGGSDTDLFVFETVDDGTTWFGSKVATYLT